ncbi:MFS transporter [Streptomyces sp. NPDC013978]|uniref:MFS transporter n=1 Tax=Streptomyces sp. NPDC013978 TaxID=3364869 RepID=UPI0036F71AE1
MSGGASALRWAAALGNADWCVMGPLVTALAAAWHTDVATVTAGIASYSLGYGCALPLWGVMADRYGPGRSLRLGLLCATAASVACVFCPGPDWWVVLRMAAGASFAAVTPSVSLCCEYMASASERHRAYAGITTVAAATAVATPFLATLVTRIGSWRQTFAVVALLAAVTMCRLRVDHPVTPTASGPDHRTRFTAGYGRRGRTRAAYWTVIGIGAAEGVALLTLPALLLPALAMSGAWAATSLAPALYAAAVCGSAALLRRHGRTWEPTRLLVLGGLTGASGAGLVAAWPGTAVLCCGALMLGVAWGCLHTTLQTLLPRLLPSPVRARAASLFAASAMLTSSVTIPIGTALLLEGLHAAVFTSGALACAGLTGLAVTLARRWT